MSKTRDWFRLYSDRLESSFKATALLNHNVTKGSSREAQVVDILDVLLPSRAKILRNCVIVDSTDIESTSFDALLVDRTRWPLLYQESELSVVMIESVLAALEIKSNLDSSEMVDICNKSASLRSMHVNGIGSNPCLQIVAGFAYQCANLQLAYFDFSTNYAMQPHKSSSVICALNTGLLFLTRHDGAKLTPATRPEPGLIPALAPVGKDSLLIFIYFLSRLAAMEIKEVDTIMAYSSLVFGGTEVHYFDEEFLAVISKDEVKRNVARDCFKRTANLPFDEVYVSAKTVIGMQ